MSGMASEIETSIYDTVPGGADLMRWFGQVPSFHDAEILGLHLRRKVQSVLRLHAWINTGEVGRDGYFVLGRHAIVTFTLSEVMDLQLDGFGIQNVIGGLALRRAPDRPERRGYLAIDPLPQDIEMELEPCNGLSGLIRARAVSITFEPGKPNAQDD
ncbi:immunity 50 family protein [Bradyrhizobium barranii subsp. barranii]|uniref:Immunity 50 family protein n=2 Tax=Bradyrhizobium barranii subsp. barranii TaxID=2823807 RepID=A0A9X9YHD9_9BRAD|nr:Imm50 family immunity protein [Bradyrhizobium barranii]UGX90344.1 immunity 50 family protein [Bradyrhizobium barranii subsp. barranii]